MIWHIPCNSNSNFRLEDCQELRSLILFLLFTTALSKGNVWYPLNRLKLLYNTQEGFCKLVCILFKLS